MEQLASPKTRNPRKRLIGVGGVFLVVVLRCFIYVRTHPLVFNESFLGHAHCIKLTGMALRIYASDHNGAFPSHTNGYGDALVLLLQSSHPSALTGPGYDSAVFWSALTNNADIPEDKCGRVYVQGLTEKCNPDIAIFFDKLATPGGDHTHFPQRLFAPLIREVVIVGDGGAFRRISEADWPTFASNQIDLLIAEGFSRELAESFYSETRGKSPP